MKAEDIQLILDKYKLKEVSYIRRPDDGMVRSYVIECINGARQRYCVKIFASRDIAARNRFLNEIQYIRKIRSAIPNKYKSWMPSITGYSLKGPHPYYVYKFIKGQNLSRFIDNYGIDYGNFHTPNFYQFIDFIWQVSQLEINDVRIPAWRNRNAKKEIKYYIENDHGVLPSYVHDQIKLYYEEHYPKVFSDFVLSHRDLYPENIIIEKPRSRNFTFLDWEYFSHVPLGFNAAFLYLMFWREEFWKAKVLAFFYNKYEAMADKKMLEKFLDSFEFCVVVLSLRFLYQLNTFVEKKDEDEEYFHAKRSFQYDLESALRGEIVRPRSIKFYLDVNDITKVAARYDLGKVKSYEIFYASKGNTVAKVTVDKESVKESYIFRFYSSSRSKRLISRELKIFEKLKDSGVRTYDVHKTIKGKNILEYKLYGKTRNIAVLSYINGKKLSRDWSNEISTANLARTLRKIHDCNILHGDFSKENVLFIKDKVSGVIDFEWGRMTKLSKPKEHDMAKAIALWLTDIRAKRIPDNEFIEIFIDYYFDKESPLRPKSGYVAKKISDRKKNRVLDLVISKINAEKEIFLTTIDMNSTKSKVTRFKKAIDNINSLRAPVSKN